MKVNRNGNENTGATKNLDTSVNILVDGRGPAVDGRDGRRPTVGVAAGRAVP